MENVLVAVIIIFILLFGAMTLTSASISAQTTMQDAAETMNARANEIDRTAISPVSLRVLDTGSTIEVTVRNDGSLKLADFSRWDVFAEYYDNSATPLYLTGRFDYDPTMTDNGTWSLGGFFLDHLKNVSEAYEAGIFNSGEEMVLNLKVAPPVGVGKSARVTVVTGNGVSAALIGTRNTPPTLPVNAGVKVAIGGTTLISADALRAEDTDNDPEDLIYTITTAPVDGTITPASFTQQMIDDGDVTYEHNGTGTAADSFEFTVSDGIDVVGAYTFAVTLNEAPTVTNDVGLVLPTGTSATITSALLETTDNDETADKLIYTITQFPSNGTLSLGSTFSQAQIDNNQLMYTHTGTDADLFKFVVSDGYDVIGAYSFVITPTP
jgi:hypothetical protein